MSASSWPSGCGITRLPPCRAGSAGTTLARRPRASRTERTRRSGWPAAEEQLARRPVLAGVLHDGVRLEARAGEQAEPDVAAEQPGALPLVHAPPRAVGVAEQERVLGHDPGVARRRSPSPCAQARAPPRRRL